MFKLHKHGISATIKDRYATIEYLFDFENPDPSQDHTYNNELTFELTIDPDAFITNIESTIDDTIYHSKITPKHDEFCSSPPTNEPNIICIAQPYDKIPNVFKITANMSSRRRILFKITIQQYLAKHFDFNLLHIQLLRNFNLYQIETTFEHIVFTIHIMDQSGIYDIEMPSQSHNQTRIDNTNMDALKQKCVVNGHILSATLNVLTIQYKTLATQPNLSEVLFDTESNTFCHTISLGSILNDEDDDEDMIDPDVMIPRRVVFVMDRSQSMQGSKWTDTVSCTVGALKQLVRDHDRYGIITYSQYIELLSSDGRMLVANEKNMNESIGELQTHRDMTDYQRNVHDALLLAIQLIKNDIQTYNIYHNQIIFLTGGEANDGVIDPQQILFNIQYANNLTAIDRYCSKISIFSFGIGYEGNDSQWIHDMEHPFLQILSVNNAGFYKRIRGNNIAYELSEYLDVLCKPILSNVVIEYNEKNVFNLTAATVNTWYAGNDLSICGKINTFYNNNEHQIHVRVNAITGKLSKENGVWITKPLMVMKTIDLVINPALNKREDNTHIERMWAYLQLRQFTDKRLVYDDMITMDIYEEEVHKYDVIALSLALKYTFMTPWTRMLMGKQQHVANGMYHVHNEAYQSTRQSRASITDIGDMHIIPHDYLDNLLENAVVHHRRKASRMEHVQTRLEKHLPNEIAATLAETLVSAVHVAHDDDDGGGSYGFVPMQSQQRHDVIHRLEKRLSIRPSAKEIETKGIVPPQYFESPEKSFMKRAVRRESAMNLLEHFLVNRQDIYDLTSRAIIYPDFIMNDHETALQQMDLRKQFVRDELNNKLNPKKRPSIYELSHKNIIPSQWLQLDIPSPLVERQQDPYAATLMHKELEALQREYEALRERNEVLTNEYNSIRETDTHYVENIEKLTLQIPGIEARREEIHNLRKMQHSMELDLLDNKAVEIELARERLNTNKFTQANERLTQQIDDKTDILQQMEHEIAAFVQNKMELIVASNAQINVMRMYLREYEKCVRRRVNMKRKKVMLMMQDMTWDVVRSSMNVRCICGNEVQFKNGDVIEWELSIKHMKEKMIVGVASDTDAGAVQFGFDNLGNMYEKYEQIKNVKAAQELRFGVNDTVHLILDCSQSDNDWSLYGFVSDEELQNTDYEDISGVKSIRCICDTMHPSSYRLSVALFSQSDSLTIQSGRVYGFC
eukprot:769924_1